MIKTIYRKKDGKVVDKLEETISVSEEEFKKAMLKNSRTEYEKQCIILNMLKRGQIWEQYIKMKSFMQQFVKV